jgi:hypothetical protein
MPEGIVATDRLPASEDQKHSTKSLKTPVETIYYVVAN